LWALLAIIAAERDNMDAAPLLGFSLISSPRVAGESRKARLLEDGLGDKLRILKEIAMPRKF
jgi:hypothetical protein